MDNPFAAAKILDDEKGVFADGAKRIRGMLVYRVIDFEIPFKGRFVYDGWWFWQRVTIAGIRVWSKVSWLRIERQVVFTLPAAVDSLQRQCRIDIHFGPSLTIRRFQVTVAGVVAYDEIC